MKTLLKELQNQLIYLFPKYFWGFNYPTKIIPRKNYKYIDVNELSSNDDIFVVRRSNFNSVNETFDDFGEVKERAIVEGVRQIPGLSLNLLSPLFTKNCLPFRQTGPAMKMWEEGEYIFIRKYIKHKTCS